MYDMLFITNSMPIRHGLHRMRLLCVQLVTEGEHDQAREGA